MTDTARLQAAIEAVVSLAESVGISTLNESDTKSSFIDPILEALGWNVRDPREVKREYSTIAGKFADYGLMVGGEPRLFVEAKDAGKNLYDDKWTSQVVGYANNEGVDWCVLTDGLVWRLFKANEPVRIDEKIAFEVDLRSAKDSPADIHRMLLLLTPEAVSRGDLHRLGTQLFVDSKVRIALTSLLENQEQGLVSLLRKNISGGSDIKPSEIRGALTRILSGLVPLLSQPDSHQATLVEANPLPKPVPSGDPRAKSSPKVTLADMLQSGVISPGPLRSMWGKEPSVAILNNDGTITFGGANYLTPSSAGSASFESHGRPGACNGWEYWGRDTAEGVKSLAELRTVHRDLLSANIATTEINLRGGL